MGKRKEVSRRKDIRALIEARRDINNMMHSLIVESGYRAMSDAVLLSKLERFADPTWTYPNKYAEISLMNLQLEIEYRGL